MDFSQDNLFDKDIGLFYRSYDLALEIILSDESYP